MASKWMTSPCLWLASPDLTRIIETEAGDDDGAQARGTPRPVARSTPASGPPPVRHPVGFPSIATARAVSTPRVSARLTTAGSRLSKTDTEHKFAPVPRLTDYFSKCRLPKDRRVRKWRPSSSQTRMEQDYLERVNQ